MTAELIIKNDKNENIVHASVKASLINLDLLMGIVMGFEDAISKMRESDESEADPNEKSPLKKFKAGDDIVFNRSAGTVMETHETNGIQYCDVLMFPYSAYQDIPSNWRSLPEAFQVPSKFLELLSNQ